MFYQEEPMSEMHAPVNDQPSAITDVTNSRAPRPSKRPSARAPASAPMETQSPPPENHEHMHWQQQKPQQQQQHFHAAAEEVPQWHPQQQAQQQQQQQQPMMPSAQSPVELQAKMGTLMSEMNSLMGQYNQAQQGGQQNAAAPPMDPMMMMQAMMANLTLMQQQMSQVQHAVNTQQPAQPTFSQAPQPAQQPSQRATAQPGQKSFHNNQNHQQTSAPKPSRRSNDSNFESQNRRGGFNNRHQRDENVSAITAHVEFKRQRIKRFECTEFVEPGQYVIVEGDRGQDCGFVIHCCVRNPDGSVARQEAIDNFQLDMSRVKPETGRVIRIATEHDVSLLHGEIASSERLALKTCREHATRLGLNMEIVDCEFQFDRKKISFYFESPEAVDFRELNMELYRIFGVRIWLENLNSKVKNTVPDGALSHADKVLYAERGLRLPRGRK